MSASELLLIDLSSIAHPIWHMSQSEPDPNATCTKACDRVRSLAAQHPHTAVCCDSGHSFRKELDPTYKAQRPASDATLQHQIRLCREQLAKDGFPVWAVKGFEADDLIASATAQALAIPDTTVLIASADKDLLQLVNGRVTAKSLRDGSTIDGEAVKAKFGVTPEQMRDYLSLVGDASDNIIGAKGIGPKKAADLLNTFGSLDDIYKSIDDGTGVFPVAVRASLVEFRPRMATVRELITLRADVEIPFAEIAAERTPKDVAPFVEDEMPEDLIAVAEEPKAEPQPVTTQANAPAAPVTVVPTQAMTVQTPDTLAPAPDEWEKQLEPRSIREAQTLAKFMYDSRLFSGYGTPAAVLSTVLAGRELGLQAMAALRGIHIVEGRHMLSSDLLRALVLRSGKAKFFRCTERTAERASFETQRGDEPPMSLTYTIQEAEQAGLVKDKSGWKKNPADMLVARASAKLARLVYPEVVHGLYAPEEMD